MKTESDQCSKEASWPKKVVRKWLNLSAQTEHQQIVSSNIRRWTGEVTRMRRKSCSDKDDLPGRGYGGEGEWLSAGYYPKQSRIRSDPPAIATTGSQNLRMFVGTWNVGGRTPHAGLNLRDWLGTPASPADIYVLGFQEIVPLNAGNVLGAEDKGPAARWLSLIGRALNFPRRSSTFSCNDGETTRSDQFPKPRMSFSDLISAEDMLELERKEGEEEEDEYWCDDSNSSDEESSAEVVPEGMTKAVRRRVSGGCGGGYRLAGSKQMVGVFLCVWVRAELLQDMTRLEISCVARGIMGYMGNKGSISISMTLRQTTFCFVCTHLASGEKEKDEVRRNSDVGEIMRRTSFPRPRRRPLPPALCPKTILQHDKVIWLGDLNYRLSSSCSDIHELLQRNDWDALLEKDQLRMEQKAGRIFTGWEEGRIFFPPTYKYLTNSDLYAVQTAKSGEKKRTPAWCDRILWRGTGLKQICYVRGESRFSDHRPVYSVFAVRVGGNQAGEGSCREEQPITAAVATDNGCKRNKTRWLLKSSNSDTTTTALVNHSGTTRVQAEEMFPMTRTQSCIETSRF